MRRDPIRLTAFACIITTNENKFSSVIIAALQGDKTDLRGTRGDIFAFPCREGGNGVDG